MDDATIDGTRLGATDGGTGGVAAHADAGGADVAGPDAPVVSNGSDASIRDALETLQVSGDGTAALSSATLTTGDLFLLRATGTVNTGADALDAEYSGFGSGSLAMDVLGGVDVGIDVGFKIERTPKGVTASRKKWFGPYRDDHTYEMIVTGAGAPLSAKMIRPSAAAAGTGKIALSIFRLPIAGAVAIETLKAPVIFKTVHTTFTTKKDAVYLLRAAGSGKVGGANLGLGDADWMDWNADGVGKLDIGDKNVDYGLGVDESDPTQTPRANWWGPWRKDHTYYMLFAGTGNPIAFTYYDVGYGDNSPTDMLTVDVFSPP